MAEKGSKSLEDFQAVSGEYKRMMHKTHSDMGQAWLKFMEDHKSPIAKRRREVLGVLTDLLPGWREMADHSEVVLGSGSPIEHEALYSIINKVNWPTPSPSDFCLVTKELLTLMHRVGRQIQEDADHTSEEAEILEQMLSQYVHTFGKADNQSSDTCAFKTTGDHDSDDCEECAARL